MMAPGPNNSSRERGSPVHLLYLVGLSALVVCAYDAVLAPFLEGGVNQYQVYEPAESVVEPTGQGRKLQYEERFLAVMRETWPECQRNHMTAIECKDFIDADIMTNFTDEDRFIRTKIVGERSDGDEWYNAVVIQMDDNDLSLGRDHDGIIYYDFLWDSAGVAATEEQEKEIPPIIATETPEGAQEGQILVPETNYQNTTTTQTDEGSGGDPASGGQPATSATAPATIVPNGAAPQLNPEDVVTVAPAIITTEPTVITTEASLTTAATTDVAVTDPPPGSGSTGATPSSPGGSTPTPPEYSGTPLVLEYEAVLAIGGNIDNVIAGNETNPINGGTLLDGSATSTTEGLENLNAALAENITIPEAGARELPPFDCKGLTGFDCCILIKHTVRDADISGKAIQCFLEYAEGTGKREYMKDMTSKKVMINANANGYVKKLPEIIGSWGNGNLDKVLEANGEAVAESRRLGSHERNKKGGWFS